MLNDLDQEEVAYLLQLANVNDEARVSLVLIGADRCPCKHFIQQWSCKFAFLMGL